MKCQKCEAIISDKASYCKFCNEKVEFSYKVIKAAKKGDEVAITYLYNATYNDVYQTIRPFIKDEDTILDIEQDTFIKAFANLDKFKGPGNFRAWIKRIAINTSKNWLKKKKPLLFSDIGDEDSHVIGLLKDERIEYQPEVVLEKEETKRLLWEIIDALPDEQRIVVAMYYFQDMSVKAIARSLKCSENTVKSRLNYARKRIETQVRNLEKTGTVLYGLAPVPFLIWLFHTNEVQAAVLPSAEVFSAVTAGLAQSTLPLTSTLSQVLQTIKNVGEHITEIFVTTPIKETVAKVAVGAIATTAIAGGTYLGIQQVVKDKEPVVAAVINDSEEESLPKSGLITAVPITSAPVTSIPVTSPKITETVLTPTPTETVITETTPMAAPADTIRNDWKGDFYFDSQGNKIDVSGGKVVWHGQLMVSNAFCFEVPESWIGRVIIEEIENATMFLYADTYHADFTEGDSRHWFLNINRSNTRSEVEQGAWSVDSFGELGEYNGTFYWVGGPTDSVISSYSQEQGAEISRIQEEARSIFNGGGVRMRSN